MGRGRPKVDVAPCRFCNKQFKRFEHLLRHERTHTREKPYECFCKKKFTRQDLLVRHTRLSHAGDKTLQSSNLEAATTSVDSRSSNELPNGSDEPADDASGSAHSEQGISDVCGAVNESPIPGPITIEQHDSTNDAALVEPQFSVTIDAIAGSPVMSHNGPPLLASPLDEITTLPHPTELRANELNWSPGGQAFDLNNQNQTTWDDANLEAALLSASFLDLNYPLLEPAPCPPAIYHDQQHDLGILTQRASDHTNIEGTNSASSYDHSFRQDESSLPTLTDSHPPIPPVLELGDTNGLGDNLHVAEPALSVASTLSLATFGHICRTIKSYASMLPEDFSMPSRHGFSRYVDGYFRSFHEAFPFMHKPTLSLTCLAPELLLAMAAVGALFKFEHSTAHRLWAAAHKLSRGQLRVRRARTDCRFTKPIPTYALRSAHAEHLSHENQGYPRVGINEMHESADDESNPQAKLQTLQALLILTTMASWSSGTIANEAMSLAAMAAMLFRELMLSGPEQGLPQHIEWTNWIQGESLRRTFFVAFIVSNVHCIAFNIAPTILNQEMQICLPSSASEWRAGSAEDWEKARQDSPAHERYFQAELSSLLQGKHIHLYNTLPGFGNHVLIHGLLQQIFLEKQIAAPLGSEHPVLSPRRIVELETALRSWQYSWEASPESTLNPFSEKGPVSFNSTAILRLSYIRLSANTGPYRYLDSRDPGVISQMFVNKSTRFFVRSVHLDRAILQSVHALSIPVRLGIPFVGHTQTMNWSISHTICNLECAMLLSRWLLEISQSVRVMGREAIRMEEKKLVQMVVDLVEETDYAVNSGEDQLDPASIDQLAVNIVRIWAETCSGQHVHDMMYIIGSALHMLGDVLVASISGS